MTLRAQQLPASHAIGIGAKRATGGALLQRKCACGNSTKSTDECPECKKKHGGILQRSPADGTDIDEVPPIVYDVLRSPGRPMNGSLRETFERRFGHDFSQVRLHNDDRASISTKSINADAYAVGQHVVIDSRRTSGNPESEIKLLAHELTHTIQQSREWSGEKLTISSPSDMAEREAERTSESLVSVEGIQTAANGVSGQSIRTRLPVVSSVRRSPHVLQRRRIDAPTDDSNASIAPPQPATALFDGSTVTVTAGGRSASCAAFTSDTAPIPEGFYCIRRQGDTQVKNRVLGIPVGETIARLFGQSHADWFLLEPQFSMTAPRSRLHLHAGSYSEGCVTLRDKSCFRTISAILNGAGSTEGLGYDGLPPGSDAGHPNRGVKSVDCIGWLTVSRPDLKPKGSRPQSAAPLDLQQSPKDSQDVNSPNQSSALPQFHEQASESSLVTFTGSRFIGAPVTADSEFVPALQRMNAYASDAGVLLDVQSSYRETTNVSNAIVPPARMSNHLVGHAVDINVLFGEKMSRRCNSRCLAKTPLPAGVAEFISAVEGDGLLRWGGRFATRDPVHIDDHFNSDPLRWNRRFRALRTVRPGQ